MVKHVYPNPLDIVKAVATQQNEIINYNTGWRVLNKESSPFEKNESKSFEVIVPYLQELEALNVNATIRW